MATNSCPEAAGTTISELHRFPVKSMLGESPGECAVTDTGLLGDRAYALIDVGDGTVVSAKSPRRWGRMLQFSARYVTEPVAGQAPPPVAITLPDGTVTRSDDADVDATLSAALDAEVRLTAVSPEDARFDEVWPEIDGLAPQGFIDGTQHSTEPTGEKSSRIALASMAPPGTFFDLASLHLITTATLDTLARTNPDADFDQRRYRPNIVLQSPMQGYQEDDWVGSVVELGSEVRARISMLTMRCVMTTVEQRDLPRDIGTLRTIAANHRLEIPGLGVWACAGVYGDVARTGTLRVGDTVTVGGRPSSDAKAG